MTRPGPISPPSALRPAVQVLGPFNSGTSLMSSYLAELFDVRSGFNLVFWKHSLAPDYRRYGKGNRLEPFTPRFGYSTVAAPRRAWQDPVGVGGRG